MRSKLFLNILFFSSPLFAMQPPIQHQMGRELLPEDLLTKNYLEKCGDCCISLNNCDHGLGMIWVPCGATVCAAANTSAIGIYSEWPIYNIMAANLLVIPATFLGTLYGGVYTGDYTRMQRRSRAELVESYHQSLLDGNRRIKKTQ